MLRYPVLLRTAYRSVRQSSQEGNKRFMQTIPTLSKRSPAASFGNLNYQITPDMNAPPTTSPKPSRWAKHSLSLPMEQSKPVKDDSLIVESPQPVVRRSRKSRFKTEETKPTEIQIQDTRSTIPEIRTETASESPITSSESAKDVKVDALPTTSKTETPAKKPRRKLRPRMALITLSPNAIKHLKALLDQPEPQLIRIGVRNRGCSGLTYHLEYVTEGGKFDELVEQDGVKVLIDLKALFLIVGSEMDWIDDKLLSRFIFKNPNSKGTCGCGESFMV